MQSLIHFFQGKTAKATAQVSDSRSRTRLSQAAPASGTLKPGIALPPGHRSGASARTVHRDRAGLPDCTSLEQWFGGAPDQVAKGYAQASPVHYARKDIPPLLLLHGTADDVVPVEQSRLLADRLAAVGARVNFLSLANARHDFDERPDANGRLAARVTLAFLDEHLKGDLPAKR